MNIKYNSKPLPHFYVLEIENHTKENCHMGLLIDVLIFLFESYEFKKVTEEDIEKNIQQLKKKQWFQEFLQKGEIHDIVIHNTEVRKKIGKIKTNKLDNPFYEEKCRRKLERICEKKAKSLLVS
jgi:hypothetical protein